MYLWLLNIRYLTFRPYTHTFKRQNGWHCIHVVSQYELSDQQLSKFAVLNIHIFKEEDFKEKITYLEK